MILSDTDLAAYLNEGKIVIQDMLDFDVQMQPASIDLRLGNEFVIFDTTRVACIDPRDSSSVINATSTIIVSDNQPFILHPGDFVLGTTYEYIKVPDDLIARLEGRSSIGRLGIIVHSTAGFIDPGFEGKITLEIGNVGKLPVALYPKMRCCQVVFEKMLSACTLSYGAKRRSKYQNQTGVQTSRIFADFEGGKIK